MTMSSTPSSPWELASLGNIPREVVSILLGSLPVVPDPRLEAQVLESAKDRRRIEDRLSEDDDDEDAIGGGGSGGSGSLLQRHNHLKDETMSMEIIKSDEGDSVGDGAVKDGGQDRTTSRQHGDERGEERGASSEESSESRPWNIPDDDWAWSDEETPAKSRSRQPQYGTTARDHDTDRRSAGSKGRTGLGLSGIRMDEQRDDSVSSTPSRASSSLSNRSNSSGRERGSSTSKTGGISTATSGTAANPTMVASAKNEWKTASHSHMTVAQDLKVSICDRGDFIVCASKKMFAILTKTDSATTSAHLSPVSPSSSSSSSKQKHHGWVLIGQGSGLDGPSDSITSVLCLPLYTPRSHQSQVYVVIGYHTGIIRIYNETGTLLVVQQLHHTPIISLKARRGSGKMHGEDEDEMTIVYGGGRVVCIEGESLWVALRMSNNQSIKSQDRNIPATQAPTFAYKKWHLQSQDHMVDAISCGPARHRPTLSNGFSSASSSALYTAKATERFVAVGSKPMIVFYASTSTGRPLFSATSLASQVASRVTSAVFGFAKSIWGASPLLRPSSPANINSSLTVPPNGGSAGPDVSKRWSTGNGANNANSMGTGSPSSEGVNPTAMAPATEVPAVLWLSDPQRCIRHVSLAPTPPRGSVHHYPPKLAAMTDSLGRVVLVDLEECEVIRMWKGLRGARCGWIQEEKMVPVRRSPLVQKSVVQGQEKVEAKEDAEQETSKTDVEYRKHLMLYLVIYAPKRGTAEIYPMRHGPREALLHVGLGWKVCTTFAGPIGQPLVLKHPTTTSATTGADPRATSLGNANTSSSSNSPGLVQCVLIGPSGEVRLIQRKSQ